VKNKKECDFALEEDNLFSLIFILINKKNEIKMRDVKQKLKLRRRVFILN